jgi:hypothetical protein
MSMPFPVAPTHARGSLAATQIPLCLVEGPALPLDAAPPRVHPRSPTGCATRSSGGGEFGWDLGLGQIVWIRSMWWLASHVDVDLNIIIAVAVNARRPSIAHGNTGGCYMPSMDTDDDDMVMVQDSSTSLLKCC